MRGSASVPALIVLDEARESAKARARASLNRSQSLSASRSGGTATHKFTHLVHSTPFMAVSGVDNRVRQFTRAYSMATLHASKSYGSMHGRISTSSQHERGPSVSSISSSLGRPPSLIDEGDDESEGVDDSSFDEAETPSFFPRLQHDYSTENLIMDEEMDIIPESQLNPPLTRSLLLAVLCAVLSSFEVGYNSSVLNVPEQVIRTALSLTDTQWSIVISIFCIGGLIGCSIGGSLSDRIGRKNYLVTNNVCFILGCLLQALARDFGMLALGRLIVGIGCGGSTVVVPLYLGEIAPANLRGSLGTMNQFACVIGILVACVLGRPLGGENEWRYLIGLVLVPSLLQIILSAVLLESPVWLIVEGGNKGLLAAEEILTSLRGTEDVDFDLSAMIHHRDATLLAAARNGNTSSLGQLLDPIYRRPLSVGFILQISQQFSGINAVFFYSTSFFISAHVNDPWLGSVLCAAVNVVAVYIALQLMDQTGRKTLLLISALGMAASAIALTYFLTISTPSVSPSNIDILHHNHPALSPTQSLYYSYLSIFFVLLFVSFFELGLGPIPWLITAELFPAMIRSSGIAVSSTINWICNFMVSLAFPHINNYLTYMAFIPFTVALILTAIFVIWYVPETRDKTLEEIEKEMGVPLTMQSPTPPTFSNDHDDRDGRHHGNLMDNSIDHDDSIDHDSDGDGSGTILGGGRDLENWKNRTPDH